MAAWLVALPVRPCYRAQALPVARVALHTARRYGLSARLLGAVACYESRGKRSTVNMNSNGSCDVGRWQVNVPGCFLWGRARYASDRRNAGRAARVLRLGWAVCKRKPGTWYCKAQRPWCRYNPGSKRWCRNVTMMIRWRARGVI